MRFLYRCDDNIEVGEYEKFMYDEEIGAMVLLNTDEEVSMACEVSKSIYKGLAEKVLKEGYLDLRKYEFVAVVYEYDYEYEEVKGNLED